MVAIMFCVMLINTALAVTAFLAARQIHGKFDRFAVVWCTGAIVANNIVTLVKILE